MKNAATSKVSPSATDIDTHIPIPPNIFGKSRMDATRIAKVLSVDINADIFPFENAVNNADANILNPQNRNETAKYDHPKLAISNTLEFLSTNIFIKLGLIAILITNHITEFNAMNFILILNKSLSAFSSFLP